jgi:hypothetical protein
LTDTPAESSIVPTNKSSMIGAINANSTAATPRASRRKASHAISSLALASNVAVFVYQVYTTVKYKRNPIKEELYTNLAAYKAVAAN